MSHRPFPAAPPPVPRQPGGQCARVTHGPPISESVTCARCRGQSHRGEGGFKVQRNATCEFGSNRPKWYLFNSFAFTGTRRGPATEGSGLPPFRLPRQIQRVSSPAANTTRHDAEVGEELCLRQAGSVRALPRAATRPSPGSGLGSWRADTDTDETRIANEFAEHHAQPGAGNQMIVVRHNSPCAVRQGQICGMASTNVELVSQFVVEERKRKRGRPLHALCMSYERRRLTLPSWLAPREVHVAFAAWHQPTSSWYRNLSAKKEGPALARIVYEL
ncbi:hypothetical protein B0H14DRAFT_3129097 [Mycena olivaceomarginata]|nr:hypothetical protein B0H14DRAFT_3129097 [Mycena olivaceomarginata]